MTLHFAQLERLWIHAGGAAKLAPTMAAIALAESKGGAEPYGDVYRGQGPTSFGLWQVHTRDANACLVNTLPGVRPYDEHRLVSDVAYNAHAAVRIERSQGLNAWSTYGHGHGAYLAFLPHHYHRRHAVRVHKHHALMHHKAAVSSASLKALDHLALCIVGAAAMIFALGVVRALKRQFLLAVEAEIAVQRRYNRRRVAARVG